MDYLRLNSSLQPMNLQTVKTFLSQCRTKFVKKIDIVEKLWY